MTGLERETALKVRQQGRSDQEARCKGCPRKGQGCDDEEGCCCAQEGARWQAQGVDVDEKDDVNEEGRSRKEGLSIVQAIVWCILTGVSS